MWTEEQSWRIDCGPNEQKLIGESFFFCICLKLASKLTSMEKNAKSLSLSVSRSASLGLSLSPSPPPHGWDAHILLRLNCHGEGEKARECSFSTFDPDSFFFFSFFFFLISHVTHFFFCFAISVQNPPILRTFRKLNKTNTSENVFSKYRGHSRV